MHKKQQDTSRAAELNKLSTRRHGKGNINMMRPITRITVLILMMTLGFSGAANAALYGDFMDLTGQVSYLNVQDVNGLYGAPSVSLDSLDFTPTSFEAQCSQCPGGSTTSDILTLDIQASGGRAISEIQINEGLDYSIQSYDSTGFASALVTALLFIDITEVNGVAINGLNANIPVVFSPAPNPTVAGFNNTETGVILGELTLDIAQIIADAGGMDGAEATRISISFDNTLTATHVGAGGQARIRKRDTDFVSMTVISTNLTPEPTTAVLLMGGLAALAARRERRQ